jgi:hypothetical protein
MTTRVDVRDLKERVQRLRTRIEQQERRVEQLEKTVALWVEQYPDVKGRTTEARPEEHASMADASVTLQPPLEDSSDFNDAPQTGAPS